MSLNVSDVCLWMSLDSLTLYSFFVPCRRKVGCSVVCFKRNRKRKRSWRLIPNTWNHVVVWAISGTWTQKSRNQAASLKILTRRGRKKTSTIVRASHLERIAQQTRTYSMDWLGRWSDLKIVILGVDDLCFFSFSLEWNLH